MALLIAGWSSSALPVIASVVRSWRRPSTSSSVRWAWRTVIGWRTRAWLKRTKSDTSPSKLASSTSPPRSWPLA